MSYWETLPEGTYKCDCCHKNYEIPLALVWKITYATRPLPNTKSIFCSACKPYFNSSFCICGNK